MLRSQVCTLLCWSGCSLLIVLVVELSRETGYSRGEVRLLDLSDFRSVTRFAEKFEAENARLDILINNAGIHNFKYEAVSSGVEAT